MTPRNQMNLVAIFEEPYARREPLKAKRLQVRFALQDEAHETLMASGDLNDGQTDGPEQPFTLFITKAAAAGTITVSDVASRLRIEAPRVSRCVRALDPTSGRFRG